MPGVRDLGITQLGKESTKGTPVATTTRWIGTSQVDPDEPVFQPQVANGLLLKNKTSDAIAIRQAKLKLMTDLTFEQLLHILMCSLKGGVTPTGAGADKTWTFNPTFTADPACDAFSVQRRMTDGSTNWDEGLSYVMGDSFEISGNIGENAHLEANLFGRPVDTAVALTGAIAVPSVNFVPTSLFKVYIDNTAAGLGGTQLSGSVISFKWHFDAMAQSKFYVDGRADKSFTSYGLRAADFTLDIDAEWMATINSERANAASRAIRFVRLEAVGASLGGSNYKVTIDLACRYAEGQFDSDGDRDGNDKTTLKFISAYDTVGPLFAKVVVVNALTSLP